MTKKHYMPVFLILIFSLPIVAGWFFYYYHAHFHFKTTNHGILVKPPIHTNRPLEKKWHMVYVPPAHCDQHCEQTFFYLQQIKKLLGKDRDRVVVMRDSSFEQVIPCQHGNTRCDFIYLIDPLGYLFMYYQNNPNPLDIFKDLKHVLEVSQIG